ncbi:hypothetical protein ACUN7V_05340 [Quadrisphaera oryzae]|uniref:hypothetical protein n=1 Tax=Quadrisphaera TaxID=317661 RepID=UPI001C954E3D|nr:hypothetical protein [Quadrisphaera sp. RL12-1S]
MAGSLGDDDDGRGRPGAARTDVVVDAANAVGSRPDGWWRDRPGAARRLLAQLALLARAGVVPGPGGAEAALAVGEVHAVLEGAARAASSEGLHAGVHVHLAPQDGDSAIAGLADHLVAAGRTVLVVTADRGLRARLPAAASSAGPGWLRAVLDELRAGDAAGGVDGPG